MSDQSTDCVEVDEAQREYIARFEAFLRTADSTEFCRALLAAIGLPAPDVVREEES